MEIPGLGVIEEDEGTGWWLSSERPVTVLGGALCRIVVDGYLEDDNKQDFHRTIANFLAADEAVLKAASSEVFAYYQDMVAYTSPGDEAYVQIASPDDVWSYVQLGDEPIVSRQAYGDKQVYVSLECNCDWEPEHGLQIVFRDGSRVSKVGPYDGHLTNGSAFDDASLQDVIYRRL
ncbi:hypothetical protein [Dyella sp. GSA-30]|uniref:DUF6985 domain-containing protein n=1 Tax=Dyella sp. GSA-30 TaxID=2994496 RepID=UPI002490AE56|nr:hypothetical protein [Dyella sp. GSA-30]BDU20560.1 hypothetical protein DYGSA30_20170 [Dyella sp. GSA-30]